MADIVNPGGAASESGAAAPDSAALVCNMTPKNDPSAADTVNLSAPEGNAASACDTTAENKPAVVKNIGGAVLAYLGDSVIELWVRERLVRAGMPGSRELNAAALGYVTAPAQAAAMKIILPLLDGEEAAIFRRGRNIGHTNLPRRATAAEYRSATGMEALMGWLHLCGRTERIAALLDAGYKVSAES